MIERMDDGGRRFIDSPYAWLRLGICLALGTVGSVGMWAVVVVLPDIQAEFGIDRAAASLPFTATMIGFGLGQVLVGRYVDRHGVALPMVIAALAIGAGFIGASLTTAVWQLTVLQGALIGLGTAACFGPLIADISHWFVRRRGVAVAITASGNYLAGVIWPTFIQDFSANEGWRATYAGIGVLCILIMVPLALMLRRRAPIGEDNHVASVKTRRISIDISPRALQIILSIAGVGCCVAMSMPQVHLVAYCADLGYGVARGAEMLSLMLAGGIISRLLSGFLADYIGGVRVLLIGGILQALALALYLPFDGLTSLYLVSLVFGLSQGGIVPSYALIVREYLPAAEAGQRVGIVIMATIIGMALGGWLSGWIYDLTGSYQAAFINGIAWNMLNIAVIATLLWRTGKISAQPA